MRTVNIANIGKVERWKSGKVEKWERGNRPKVTVTSRLGRLGVAFGVLLLPILGWVVTPELFVLGQKGAVVVHEVGQILKIGREGFRNGVTRGMSIVRWIIANRIVPCESNSQRGTIQYPPVDESKRA